jgi:hypothetical protein
MQAQSNAMPVGKCHYEVARRYPRTMFSIPIDVRMLMPGGVRCTHGVSLDISEGGLGALVQSNLQPGDVIAVDMKLPTQDLTAIAIVRHSDSGRSGFEFLGLSPEERRQFAGLAKAGAELGNRIPS